MSELSPIDKARIQREVNAHLEKLPTTKVGSVAHPILKAMATSFGVEVVNQSSLLENIERDPELKALARYIERPEYEVADARLFKQVRQLVRDTIGQAIGINGKESKRLTSQKKLLEFLFKEDLTGVPGHVIEEVMGDIEKIEGRVKKGALFSDIVEEYSKSDAKGINPESPRLD